MAKNWKKYKEVENGVVYVLETAEPKDKRFEDGLCAGMNVYLTREDAQIAADGFNDFFPDWKPQAQVEELVVQTFVKK
jgi:hypothetical protein